MLNVKEISSPSITKVVQNLSEDVTVSINEHRFAVIVIPGFRHKLSEHRLGMVIDDKSAGDLKVPTTNVEFNRLCGIRHDVETKEPRKCEMPQGEKIFLIVGEGADYYRMKISVSVRPDRGSSTYRKTSRHHDSLVNYSPCEL
jgi:hypothetical protein